MPGSVRRIRTCALLTTAAPAIVLAACTETTAPRQVLGTYVLRTVEGHDQRTRGPVDAMALGLSGYVKLQSGGSAERVLQVNRAPARKDVGTFRVWGTTLDLRLHEGVGDYVWRPSATLVSGVLTIRHPAPADGPDIVETYTRP